MEVLHYFTVMLAEAACAGSKIKVAAMLQLSIEEYYRVGTNI